MTTASSPPPTSSPHGPKDAHGKALAINLDRSIYGCFAEIGAGQEVARWFLTVGGASGTVAQTVCAYDKTVSDDTYGAGTRYVSRERLIAMLDHEYRLLIDRLAATRGPTTRFFVFADTVATRSFKGDNDQHGWMGIRFQLDPGKEPSDLLLHVNLLDDTAQEQQQAIGLLGVNLLYAAHFHRASRDEFLTLLWAELSNQRLEIDVIELRGPVFEGQDCREWNLQLLRRDMAKMIVIDAKSGQVVEPSDVLRKRPLIIDRGRFREIEPFHAKMLSAGTRQLREEGIPLGRDPIALPEISLTPPVIDEDTPDDAELLRRIDAIRALGPVIVSNLAESYRLIPNLRRYTSEPIRLVAGISLVARMMQSRFYSELPGSLLEGMGKLFASNVKMYAYPMPRAVMQALIGSSTALKLAETGSDQVTAADLIPEPPVSELYRYLLAAQQVVPIRTSE